MSEVTLDSKMDSMPDVVIRPSSRRRRTVSAHREGNTVVVLVPARMNRADQRAWAEHMVARVELKEKTLRLGGHGDQDLLTRGHELAGQHLPELKPAVLERLRVTWSSRQRRRWASCTPVDSAIRVSDRLRGVPGWVLDDVLLHELAHLVEPNHSPAFWALLARHGRHEAAAQWLEGYAAGLEKGGDREVHAGGVGENCLQDSMNIPELPFAAYG